MPEGRAGSVLDLSLGRNCSNFFPNNCDNDAFVCVGACMRGALHSLTTNEAVAAASPRGVHASARDQIDACRDEISGRGHRLAGWHREKA